MTDKNETLSPCPFDKLLKTAKKQKRINGPSPRGNAYWKGYIAAIKEAKQIWNTRAKPKAAQLVWNEFECDYFLATNIHGKYMITKEENYNMWQCVYKPNNGGPNEVITDVGELSRDEAVAIADRHNQNLYESMGGRDG